MPLPFPSRDLLAASGAFGGFSGVIRTRGITQSCSRWCKYPTTEEPQSPPTTQLEGRHYPIDEWTNLPSHISCALPRKLHLQPSHPLSIIKRLIESRFPSPIYEYHNDLFPIVSVHQNFDSLGFPIDHPGTSRTDTYYVNKDTILCTHTSAHQADTRDAIDWRDYQLFHQMEGASLWSRRECKAREATAAVIKEDIEGIPKREINFEDPNPNSMRRGIRCRRELWRALEALPEHVVEEVFGRRGIATAPGDAGAEGASEEPLRVRWAGAYFLFTSPSWELQVYWQGNWLELLGCGIIQQSLPKNADIPNKVGWAFGVGPDSSSAPRGQIPFHENDMMELEMIDESTHPKTGGNSLCFRNNHRSLERSLHNDEVNSLQQMVKKILVEEFGLKYGRGVGSSYTPFFLFSLLYF
ncbi:hypothetical protein B9Z19DRAFT_1102579 [Tuber borchii]|uniref:Phenylalanyl-tRNA synthetase domain-containing protein n=1 Tax=Tuber borchii TaxID=42251 RepID=A0A2T6ZKN1_TUBBO|nr:hypothetical protein B9Z19DRAFT_1102579 [Tuber borchii]